MANRYFVSRRVDSLDNSRPWKVYDRKLKRGGRPSEISASDYKEQAVLIVNSLNDKRPTHAVFEFKGESSARVEAKFIRFEHVGFGEKILQQEGTLIVRMS